MTTTSHYRLRGGDTLEGIASRLLGDPGLWPDIVALNRLRAPFISDDPADQLGPALAMGTLASSSPAPAGATTIDLPLVTARLARKNYALYLRQHNAGGGVDDFTGTLTIDGTDLGNGSTHLTFTPALPQLFNTGADWRISDNPHILATRVLRTGDFLVLPSDTPVPADEVDQQAEDAQFQTLLGRDMQLDETLRELRWDSTTHDFALVTGTKNLVQAVRLRLQTRPGELAFHPTYGDRLLEFIGSKNSFTFAALADGLLRDSLSQESRIDRVESITTRIDGDKLYADLSLRVRNLATLLNVNSLGINV